MSSVKVSCGPNSFSGLLRGLVASAALVGEVAGGVLGAAGAAAATGGSTLESSSDGRFCRISGRLWGVPASYEGSCGWKEASGAAVDEALRSLWRNEPSLS